MHVDEFIDNPPDDEDSRYAAFFFLLHRLPAVERVVYDKWISLFKLFCTHNRVRYRVTGASRLGDVWLQTDFSKSVGYTRRVDLDSCSQWSHTPEVPNQPTKAYPLTDAWYAQYTECTPALVVGLNAGKAHGYRLERKLNLAVAALKAVSGIACEPGVCEACADLTKKCLEKLEDGDGTSH